MLPVEIRNNYYIWPRDLNLENKVPELLQFTRERGMNLAEGDYLIYFDEYSSGRTNDLQEFLTVLKHRTVFQEIEFRCHFKSEDDKTRLYLALGSSSVLHRWQVTIDSSSNDTTVAAHAFIKQLFGFDNPTRSAPDPRRKRNLHATVFLGRHFDDYSEEPARRLRRFLELSRFRVAEADCYQAEPIPDKVKALIDQQDIYIGLVTGDRDHSWLIAEPAYAQGKGKHVIMVLEDGVRFNPTTHGQDWEQVRFSPPNVEQSFIKLLEEFRSVGVLGM